MRNKKSTHEFPFQALFSFLLFSAGCGRITSDTAPALAHTEPVADRRQEIGEGSDTSVVANDASQVADDGIPAAEQPLPSAIPNVIKNEPSPIELVYAALDEQDEAVQAYTQAIAADSSWWRPHAGRTTSHYGKKDLQAELNDFKAAIERAPREPSIYENRAVVLEGIGRIEEAKRDRAVAKILAAGGIL